MKSINFSNAVVTRKTLFKIRYILRKLIGKLIGEVYIAEIKLKRGLLDLNGYYDILTGLIIKRVLKPSSVCIDVGAHEGAILRLMKNHAPNGTFFAFEPLPHLYEKLLEEFGEKHVHIYNLALSDTSGVSSFNYVTTNPGYSGLKKRRYDRPNEKDKQIQVKTELLDTILAEKKPGRVSFIKIDVEGAEYLVIKGAQEHIRKDKPIIVFEHGLGSSEYYGVTPEDLFHLLTVTCELRISLLPDWLLAKPSLDLKSFCDQYYNDINFYFVAHE